MSNKLSSLLFALLLLLWACPPPPPEDLVVVPAADNTPLTLAMDVHDPDLTTINPNGSPVTILVVSDVASVIASARDDDGGIKSVRMLAKYTYSKPGDGLEKNPATVNESVSSASAGRSTEKSRTVAYNFDLKKERVGWSSVKVDVWIEAENFYGPLRKTPLVSLTYKGGDTDYMAACRSAGVPIPPDWAPSGTEWVYHGNLGTGTNLLEAGQNAFVWTWSHPVRRGACIVLPRGSGGPRGDLAGIICQSATTGKACFWDSRKRNDNDPLSEQPLLDWTQGLRIGKLKDGSNLTEAQSGRCPMCHQGNNVFLIAPDDEAWSQVLRKAVLSSTFTTKVEGSSEVDGGGRPRYVPITSVTGAERPGWENIVGAEGCAAACHESSTFPFSPSSMTMPPACGQNCYRY